LSKPFSAEYSLQQGKIQGIIAVTTFFVGIILPEMPVLSSVSHMPHVKHFTKKQGIIRE
jgi:hypothetical protein